MKFIGNGAVDNRFLDGEVTLPCNSKSTVIAAGRTRLISGLRLCTALSLWELHDHISAAYSVSVVRLSVVRTAFLKGQLLGMMLPLLLVAAVRLGDCTAVPTNDLSHNCNVICVSQVPKSQTCGIVSSSSER